MLQEQKEYYIYRISCEQFRLTVNGRPFLFKWPGKIEVLNSYEIYLESLENAKEQGLYTEQQAVSLLIEKNLWSDDEEKMFHQIAEDINTLKEELYRATFDSTKRKLIKDSLKIAKDKVTDLANKRNALLYYTQEGYANACKTKYILGCGLHTKSGRKIFKSNKLRNAKLIDDMFPIFLKNKISDTLYREIARTMPWQATWYGAKQEGTLFGKAVIDYTEEQIILSNWSLQYDNISQHPEAPSQAVISDDDALDGWLIIQHKKSIAASDKKDVDQLVKNPKIKDADEIGIVAGTLEDAKRLGKMNSSRQQSVKHQRMKHIKKHKRVDEFNMPDTQQNLQMEYNNMYKEKFTK